MPNEVVRRQFLNHVLGSGALVLAGCASPAAAEDKFLTSAKLGNFDLYYEIHGDGPAIVFAHGAGGTHLSWFQQIPVLSQHYKCITIDHRTFGHSRDSADGPGRTAFVQDLTGLLDHLGIQKTALVGQSMGGLTVLGFASAHPERVTALMMSDTTGGYSNPEIAELRRALPPGPASIDRAFAPDFAKRDPVRAFLYKEINALNIASNPVPGTANSATPTSANITPVLEKKIPVLFIVGEQDQLIPPAVIESMHKAMPGSQLVKVPGAGHSVYFEKPDEYNRIVMDFLAKHTGA
jgi:3-oxoadipate enol-lactonase